MHPVAASEPAAAPPVHREIELKLALPPRLAARIATHREIERYAVSPPRSEHLVSIYYDTPDFDLARADIALRLRRTDTGWVQTLKYGGSMQAGLHQRIEIETPRATKTLDTHVFTGIEAPRVRPAPAVLKRLKPSFATEFERTTRRLALPSGGSALMCVDRGMIIAGVVRERISEVELEIIDGAPAALFELVAQLGAVIALRPEPRSKAARGFALAGYPVKPVKAGAPAVTTAMPLGAAIGAIVSCGLEQLQANEHGTLAGRDPEYLHQMRVAVRRLRSVLAACSAVLAAVPFDALRAELKWLGTRLGAARDWDVLCGELWPPLRGVYPHAADIERFQRAADAQRARARLAATRAVKSIRYGRLVLALGRVAIDTEWQRATPALNGAVAPFAGKLLDRRLKGMLKRAPGKQRPDLGELHELRIAVKKLRYAAEFFADLYAVHKTTRYCERLADLQDLLGTINDATTMATLARAALPGNRRFEYIVAGWNARIIDEGCRRLRGEWRAVRRSRKFW